MSFRVTAQDLAFDLYKTNTKVSVYPSVTPGSTLSIYPLPGNNLIRLRTPIDNSMGVMSFNLTINSSRSSVGDQIILQFSINNIFQTTTMNLPSNVILTACGSVVTSLTVNTIPSTNIIFVFDGQNFLCTFDNC